jgi:hypothetical protein
MHRISPRFVTVVFALLLAAFATQAQPQETPPATLAIAREGAKATVEGAALDSSGQIMPNAIVRLRDARTGQIVATGHTDKVGLFHFASVEPGLYVAEIVGTDQTVVASSWLLTVDPGEFVSATVRLPFRLPIFGGFLGNSVPSAVSILSAAAASGVLATSVTGVQVCEMPTR